MLKRLKRLLLGRTESLDYFMELIKRKDCSMVEIIAIEKTVDHGNSRDYKYFIIAKSSSIRVVYKRFLMDLEGVELMNGKIVYVDDEEERATICGIVWNKAYSISKEIKKEIPEVSVIVEREGEGIDKIHEAFMKKERKAKEMKAQKGL